MSANKLETALKNKVSYKKAIIVIALALLMIAIFLSPSASTNTRTSSSIENIDWGMSPDDVRYLTKDYSRDAKYIERDKKSVLIQRERITESEIAARSVVEYLFVNERLNNIKITKTIKYWPDHILDQLLMETVPSYEIMNATNILNEGRTYFAENRYETKLIYLGFNDSQKPEYVYVELGSKNGIY